MKRFETRFGIALLTTLLIAGCSPDWVERSVQMKFTPESDDFWDMPLPSELRRQADGSYGVSKWPEVSSNGYIETVSYTHLTLPTKRIV